MVDISFKKHCRHYVFQLDGRQVAATVVTVPELPNTFLEVEILAPDEGQVSEHLRWLEAFATDNLGLSKSSQTTDTYMGQVAEVRHRKSSAASHG